MIINESDLNNIASELNEHYGIEIVSKSMEDKTIIFNDGDDVYTVTFKFLQGDTTIKPTKIKRVKSHKEEEVSIPYGLDSGNYDELVANLLHHLDIIDESTRDEIVYGFDPNDL